MYNYLELSDMFLFLLYWFDSDVVNYARDKHVDVRQRFPDVDR